MPTSKIFNWPVILLNFALAALAAGTVGTSIYKFVGIFVAAALIVLLGIASVCKVQRRFDLSWRIFFSLLGTVLLWIPIYNALGVGESELFSGLINSSLIAGCVLLIGSAVWPSEDQA